MTLEIAVDDLQRFRAAITESLGLSFEEGKSGFLADVLRRRLDATRLNVEGYLDWLESGPAKDEIGALARELTVAETYFFRNVAQYHALREVVLPDRVAAPRADRHLRLVSLGCASGEEAYSLAIAVHDALPDRSWTVSILGVDVNPHVIDKARRARYSSWSLRETAASVQQRWFRPAGREFILEGSVRASVRFEEHNLVGDDPRVWRPGAYDVVFCRNVLMYFAPAQAQALVARIVRSLAPGGYLFLGHAETLRGLSNEFHLCHTHDTFYYQRREDVDVTSPIGPLQTELRASVAPVLDARDADSWVDVIRHASARVAALTEPHASGSRASNVARPVKPAWDVGLVLELLQKERFTDALAMVDALPPTASDDRDILLLRAVLLTHGGQLARAEGACRRLLEVDELNAGAHYLLALCREGVGDRAGASYHDQVAVYLDPGFAMPRLHLGLLARRAGETAAARHDLGQALVLLQREDASRVLLFGGGFGRDALVALCRTELSRCEAAS